MIAAPLRADRSQIPFFSLVPFLLIAFGLAWGILALFIFQLINPIWPDAQPYDTLFFVAAAVLVVWFNRKTMFSRERGVTEVMPQVASGLGLGD